MNSSIRTTIGRTGLALIAAVMTAVFAGLGRSPGGIARRRAPTTLVRSSRTSQPAAGTAHRGGVFDRPAASSATTPHASSQAITPELALRGRATRRPHRRQHSVLAVAYDWGDFGIGAGAMPGLVLLLGGLAAGAHYGAQRSGVDARTAS